MSTHAPIDADHLYADARVYDILHRPGTADEVTTLERIAARFGESRRADRWLEPACGTGRLLRVAAARGRRVTGFDLEPAMIEYARDRLKAQGLASRARLFVADMRSFADHAGPPADLAFCTINTIRHLTTDDAMLRHFQQAARALRPGALYVVGLSTTLYGCEQETEDVWQATRAGTRVTQTVQYLPPSPADRAETVISHLEIERTGRATESRTSRYTLRSYSLSEWTGLVDASGFELLAPVDDGAFQIDPPRTGYAHWVLRAPG
ncbi:MAG: class I SAM-dependent methyltransferase [Phycisphaerales bacterium JB040]